MGAVGGAKSVINVILSIACQSLGELLLRGLDGFLGFIVTLFAFLDATRLAFFLGIEAEVLEHQHFTGFHGGHLVTGFHAVLCELHGTAQQLFQMLDDGLDGELRVGILLRATEMRHQYHHAFVVQNLVDGGQSGTHTSVVGDVEIVI